MESHIAMVRWRRAPVGVLGLDPEMALPVRIKQEGEVRL
jgi:hypothetical protein